MLPAKYTPLDEELVPPSTWRDWLSTAALFLALYAGVRLGSYAVRAFLLPPGSALHSFFTTPRGPDLCAAGAASAALLFALLLAGLVARLARWVRHADCPPDAPLRRWQVLNLAAFGLARVLSAADIRLDVTRRAPAFHSYFAPAPWAFGIWFVIFAWEAVFLVYQALPPQRGNVLLAAISPYWLAANAFQGLWCFVFCPYAEGVIYLNTLFLAGTAVALFGAFHIVTQPANRELRSYSVPFWACTQVPLTLHFGWITAAVLVSLNGVLVRLHCPLPVQLVAANASLVLATVLGLGLMAWRFDALYGLTLAWAVNGVRCGLLRCAADVQCREALCDGLPPNTLDRLALTAALFTAALLAVAGAIVALKAGRLALFWVPFEKQEALLQRVPSALRPYLE